LHGESKEQERTGSNLKETALSSGRVIAKLSPFLES
jgi:hypothetical protein